MLRFLKQFIYGLFYLAILGGIGYGVYASFFTAPPATCSDNIKNQGEEDIDCGGPAAAGCIPCELKKLRLTGFKSATPQIIPASETSSAVLLEIENPSSNFGLKRFDYSIEVLSKFGLPLTLVRDSARLAPGEKKYIVAPGLDFSSQIIGSAEFRVVDMGKLDWRPLKDFGADPEILITDRQTTELSNATVAEGYISMSAPVKSMLLLALGFNDGGEVYRVSELRLRDLPAGRQSFRIFLPKEKYGNIDVSYHILPD